MKNIFVCLVSIFLSTFSLYGYFSREDKVLKKWDENGEEISFCEGAYAVYYLRDSKNNILAAWSVLPKDYFITCIPGENEYYIVEKRYMAGAYTIGTSNLLSKLKKEDLKSLPSFSLQGDENKDIALKAHTLAQKTREFSSEVELNGLPRETPWVSIRWIFSIESGTLIARPRTWCTDPQKSINELKNVDYYFYDEKQNKFFPKYKQGSKEAERNLSPKIKNESPTSRIPSDSTSPLSAKSPASSFPWLGFACGAGALLVLGGGLFLWRRRKRSRA